MFKKLILSAVVLLVAIAAHSQRWDDLNKQVLTYLNNGDYSNALNYAKQARELARTEFGETHADYSASLHNLAAAHKKMGQYQNAESLYWEALKIDKQVLGVQHQNYALSLFGLANLYKLKKEYSKSESIYLDALDIMRKTVGEQHPDYGLILGDYGDLFTSMGNYKKAESTLRKAKDITYSAVGSKHEDYAGILFNIGKLYKTKSTLSKADEMLNQALLVYRGSVGEGHPDYEDCKKYLDNLYNPGFQLYQQDRNEQVVEAPVKEPLTVLVEPVIPEPVTPVPAGDMSKEKKEMPIEASASTEEEPIDYIKSVTEPIVKETPPPPPPPKKTWRDFDEMMDQYAAEKDYHEAIAVGEKALRMVGEETGMDSDSYKKVSLKLATNYKNAGVYNKAIPVFKKDLMRLEAAVGTDHPSYQSRMAELVELYNATGQEDKAKALEMKAVYGAFEKANMTDSPSPESVKMLEVKVADYYRAESAKPQVGNNIQNFNLILKGKKLDAALGIESSIEGKVADLHTLVKDKIRINEAVIDFMIMKNKETGMDEYYALVTRFRSEETIVVPLAQEENLKKILSIDAGSAYSYTQNAEVNKELYQMIWQPLEEHLKGINFLSISSVGLLNRVAFGGLAGEDKTVLADRYDIHYFSSLRDYIQEKERTVLNKSVVFFGGAVFGENTNETGLNYMPATKEEVNTFKVICNAKGWNVETFVENNASENNAKMKAGENAAGILHLATPTYFQNNTIQSGIAFSNANVALAANGLSDTEDDGLLTANEIAQMDFSKTNLVLLSASETGAEDSNYNGIIGIQRAFKKAGAHSVLFSQWKVPDKQTQELLTLFYFNHLSGMSVHKSLTSAQEEIRKLYQSPYFWAGFILME